MRGHKDFPQDDWNGESETEYFVKTLAILLLWIIFIFGAYHTISWCAGPEVEDLFRGYDLLTGKQRRQRLRESSIASINRILRINVCLFGVVSTSYGNAAIITFGTSSTMDQIFSGIILYGRSTTGDFADGNSTSSG